MNRDHKNSSGLALASALALPIAALVALGSVCVFAFTGRIAVVAKLRSGGKALASSISASEGSSRGDWASQNGPIPLTFFGLDINSLETPWPPVPFGTIRMFGNLTTWRLIERRGRNQYNWRILDAWLERAQKHHMSVLYTVGDTPAWAAANPEEPCGMGRMPHNGQCSPPSDLYTEAPCQGPLAGVTATNCQFKEFLTSLMNHVCTGKAPNKNCIIHNFSCWNEPNLDAFWEGSYADMARMCSDFVETVKAQCQTCTTLSPEVSAAADVGRKRNGDTRSAAEYLEQLLKDSQKYGHPFDGVAFHPYAGRTWGLFPAPFPETFVGSGCRNGGGGPDCPRTLPQKIAVLRRVMDENGMTGKPLWSTEGSWGINRELPDPDVESAFVARWLILQASDHVSRAIWYLWDNGGRPMGVGGLWDRDRGLTKAGVAYGEVARWLTGATFIAPCSAKQNVWTCDLSRPGGYRAKMVWDAAHSYAHGPTASYRTPADFLSYRNLAGKSRPIQGGTVPIGSKPVLLENRSRN
jgi:hypothetical protein